MSTRPGPLAATALFVAVLVGGCGDGVEDDGAAGGAGYAPSQQQGDAVEPEE